MECFLILCMCVGPCSRFQLCLSREYSSPGKVFISLMFSQHYSSHLSFFFCRVICTSSFIISASTLTSLAMRPRYSLLHHSFIHSFISSLFVSFIVLLFSCCRKLFHLRISLVLNEQRLLVFSPMPLRF